MVGLAQDGEAIALEAVNQPHLPQRSPGRQGQRKHAAAQDAQRLLVRGPGKRGRPHVKANVEAVIVDPHRAALIQRDPGQALAVARHEVEPGLDVLDEVVVGGRRALENQHRGDVQRGRLVLEMQEGSVEWSEAVVHDAVSRGVGCSLNAYPSYVGLDRARARRPS